MNEMIERVARAIYAKRVSVFSAPRGRILSFDELPASQQMREFDQARVAIEAMREPTEAMLVAGEGAAGSFSDRWLMSITDQVYGEMIDAALTDKPSL